MGCPGSRIGSDYLSPHQSATMTPPAHRITLDASEGSRPDVPAAPECGLVLAYVPESAAAACGRHLVEFAHRWRDEGHRVVLADACVASPILHKAASVENGEGLTDLVLHGTSLARVSQGIDNGVDLVTAGTIAPDADRVLHHPRWTTLAARFHETAGLLVVSVPADAEAPRLEGLASAVVRFVSTDDAPAAVAADAVGAESHGSPPTPASETAPGSIDTDAATGAPAPRSPDSSREVASPRRAKPPEPRSRTGVLLVLLLLVVVGTLGAAFMGLIEIPGVTPVDVGMPVDLLSLP